MLFRQTLCLTVALIATPSLAYANSGGYVGGAIEANDLESYDSGGIDILPEATTTAVIRGGFILHQYFAIEGEVGLGIDNTEDDGIADYENRFAGYGRARYPFGDSGAEIFVRLGFGSTSIESRNVNSDGSLSGLTYGGGLAFSFGGRDQYQIRGDFTQFEYGNNQNSSAFAIGVGYNF